MLKFNHKIKNPLYLAKRYKNSFKALNLAERLKIYLFISKRTKINPKIAKNWPKNR